MFIDIIRVLDAFTGDFDEDDEPMFTPEDDAEKAPMSIRIDQIIKYEPSFLNKLWVDIHLLDGDVIAADMTYFDFKVKLAAIANYPQDSFLKSIKMTESKKVTVYKN